VEKALAGLQGVLQATADAVDELERQHDAAAAAPHPHLLSSRERTAAVFRARELRLVQAQGALLAPHVVLRAEPL
jgi:hypothetical protein